jgi:hypothetical protein
MTWMTINNAQLQVPGGFGEIFNNVLNGMTVNLTGLNGSVTFLVKTPIWFIIGIAITASGLQLASHSRNFEVPVFVEWMAAIAGVVWTIFPAMIALMSGKVSLGMGWVLGLFCASVPLICLALPTKLTISQVADQ